MLGSVRASDVRLCRSHATTLLLLLVVFAWLLHGRRLCAYDAWPQHMLLLKQETAAEQPGSGGSYEGSGGSPAGSNMIEQPRVVIVDLLHSSCCSDQQVLDAEVQELNMMLSWHGEEGGGGADISATDSREGKGEEDGRVRVVGRVWKRPEE